MPGDKLYRVIVFGYDGAPPTCEDSLPAGKDNVLGGLDQCPSKRVPTDEAVPSWLDDVREAGVFGEVGKCLGARRNIERLDYGFR